MSFLGMPQIAHFQVEKWKSSLPWEGGHPPPTLPPLGRYAPSQMFWLITPLLGAPPPNALTHGTPLSP